MAKQIDIQVTHGIGYIKEFNGVLQIGSKEKFEPMIDRLKKEVPIKIKGIGKRYAPNLAQYNELNYVDLSLQKKVTFLSSFNDIKELFVEHMDEIFRYEYVKEIREIKNLVYVEISTMNEKTYRNSLEKIALIFEKAFRTIKLMERTAIHGLANFRGETGVERVANTYRNISSRLDYFGSFLSDVSFDIFEKKVVLITGEALIGKTHLMCDTSLNILNSNQPTLLFFGHEFSSEKSILSNMISRLGITDCNEIEFLEALNQLGIEHNTRTLIMIDAINETENPKIWQNGIIEFCEKIKSYTNLALALSIRDVEKNKLITNDNEKYIEEEIVEIQHKGFEGIEIEAVRTFCDALEVEFPKVPIHTNRLFVNPGILFLYIETIKESTKKIDTSIINPTTIFKAYIDNLNKKFSQENGIDEDDRVVEEAINLFISLGIQQDYTHFYLPQKMVSRDIKLVHEKVLEFLKSEGVLNKLNIDNEVKLYFTYQKFESFFIAEYLLNNFEKNKSIIFNLIRDYNGAMTEALFMQIPEKFGKEIFDLNVWMIRDRYICEQYIASLVWRKSSTITDKTFRYLNYLLPKHGLHDNYLDIVLQLSSIPNHQFNIERLHRRLLRLSISERDYEWSIYIHNSYVDDGIVKRIIEWAWNKEAGFEINDDSLYLYGLTLGWFLASSNRLLRDGTTKALVNIFTDRADVFYKVLREFESVNDLYVLERLYTVGYGITLRSRNYSGLKELGFYIYQTTFDVEAVVEHILIRDYAKLTVEHINGIYPLNIDSQKVQPPYRSAMPKLYPTNDEIQTYRDSLGSGISSIIGSMRTEAIGHYGDFGRYTFQSSLRDFNHQPIKFQDLSNFAVTVILEEYISDMALFEEAESRLQSRSSSRYDHNVERIGKKYQWMALHKVLAMIADNFEIEDSQGWNKFVPYEGTYQTYIRNIDPTTILKKKHEDNAWVINLNADFEHLELSDIEWMSSSEKLPMISDLINLEQNQKEYLILSASFSVDGNKEKEKYRNLYYHIDSFIIEKKNLNTFTAWAKEQNFYGQDKMPKTNSFHEVYLREYPNGKAYDHIDSYYYGQMHWDDTYGHEKGKIPCKVLLTSTTYLNEGRSYDKSVEEGVKIYLPNKWLVNKMGLKQTLHDGEWVNNDSEVVFFDQTIRSNIEFEYKNNSALVADKNILMKFLNENDLSIVWVMWGEKQVRDMEINHNHDDFLGIAEIDSYSYLDKDQIIDSQIKILFGDKK